MYAIFSDEAYNDFMSGSAVDNNGLRSPKGSFYPDQPSFEPINELVERLQDAGVRMLIEAGRFVVFDIVLPEANRFVHEKVCPFVAEKWDSWQDKRRVKNAQKQVAKKESESTPEMDAVSNTEVTIACRIINLDDYRKMA